MRGSHGRRRLIELFRGSQNGAGRSNGVDLLDRIKARFGRGTLALAMQAERLEVSN